MIDQYILIEIISPKLQPKIVVDLQVFNFEENPQYCGSLTQL